MPIERNPVVAPPDHEGDVFVNMKRRLECRDFDEYGQDRGSRICRDELANNNKTFKCPNVRNGSKRCLIGGFLYPRYIRRSDGSTHFHQGIDLSPYYGKKNESNFRLGADFESDPDGKTKPRANIISVVEGKVVHDGRDVNASYGIRIVIRANETIKVDGVEQTLFYIYAHCHESYVYDGDTVLEQDVIGLVGRTGIGTASISDHLHFEVSTKKDHTRGAAQESKLGEEPLFRQDPLKILARLGPWGNNKVATPFGEELTSKKGRILLQEIERIAPDGCYPIGANSLWHGGVHLPMARETMLHAPLSGTLVAARLGSDPTLCEHEFGSANFILLRHELPRSIVSGSKGGGDDSGGGGSSRPDIPNGGKSIGVDKANPPEQVKQLKERLQHLGYYEDAPDPDDPDALDDLDDPDDPAISEADEAAIVAFQKQIGSPYRDASKPWPDAVVTIGGHTWTRLFAENAPPASGQPIEPPSLGPGGVEPPGPPKPSDPKRTVYTLLMHLAPLGADEALARGATWLPTVTVSDPAEEAEDAAEAAEHRLLGDVGRRKRAGAAATLVGAPVDVQWVSARLIRFGLLSGPPLVTTTIPLVAAIEEFQKTYPFKKEGYSDGLVERGAPSRPGTTATWLAKTFKELRGGEDKARVDPELVSRFETPDSTGTTSVLVLNQEVQAGDPLWPSGESVGFDEFLGPVVREEIHWEMFSEELLLEGWNPGIKDENDDLTTDLSPEVIAEIEQAGGGIVNPSVFGDGHVSQAELEAFYRSEDGARFRKTPVKFRSEWGADLDAMVAALKRTHADPLPPFLKAMILPYQWWFDAADVLPKSPKVWHYHPVEFLSRYQEALGALAPGPPRKPPPPEEVAHLKVVVKGDNGMPPKKQSRKHKLAVTVYPTLSETGVPQAVADNVDVDKHGTVRVSSISPGPYMVALRRGDATLLERNVEVRPSSEVPVEVLELKTSLEGQGFGNLSIYIKQAEEFGPATAARVSVVGPAFPDGIEKRAWGSNAVVVLKSLQPGTYTVQAHHGGSKHPNDAVEGSGTIEFSGAGQKELVQLGYPRCTLTLVYDGGPESGTLTWPDAVVPDLFDFMRETPLSFANEGRNEVAIEVLRSKHPYQLTIGGKTRPVSASRRERRFVFRP